MDPASCSASSRRIRARTVAATGVGGESAVERASFRRGHCRRTGSGWGRAIMALRAARPPW